MSKRFAGCLSSGFSSLCLGDEKLEIPAFTGTIVCLKFKKMTSLFQKFEFRYPTAYLFFDRSGTLSNRLAKQFPGLVEKDTALRQRDFMASGDLEMFFGSNVSRIQSLATEDEGFPEKAAGFLGLVAEVFEIPDLERFSFRHVMGQSCNSSDEAHQQMMRLISDDQKAKMAAVSPLPLWRSLQGEFSLGAFDCEHRISIMQLPSRRHDPVTGASAGEIKPHITFHFEQTGVDPIGVSELDAAAFMENVRSNLSREILAKLAPQLAHDCGTL